MHKEQKIRAILFYLSVFVFFTGLPFILSFALGYKFDQRSFKFTKAGLIALKTQPVGADVYLNDIVLNEKTPLTINELLPGTYNIKINLEKYYPWTSEVIVEAGKVSRLEKIILFPLRPDIKQLNKDKLSSFWVDESDKKIYYINQEDNSIYVSDLEGEHYTLAVPYIAIEPPSLRFKLSPDKQKLLYFNKHQIAVVDLTGRNKETFPNKSFVLKYPAAGINDIFWHSDSYHLIIVTDKKIEALEAKPELLAVELVSLNKKNAAISYDVNTDSLYFVDYQKADDGNFYNNLYKLDLSPRTSPLKDLIKIKTSE